MKPIGQFGIYQKFQTQIQKLMSMILVQIHRMSLLTGVSFGVEIQMVHGYHHCNTPCNTIDVMQFGHHKDFTLVKSCTQSLAAAGCLAWLNFMASSSSTGLFCPESR